MGYQVLFFTLFILSSPHFRKHDRDMNKLKTNRRSFLNQSLQLSPFFLFGPEDRLLNWFADVAKTSPIVPMVDGGGAITKPVYMADIAQAIVR